MCLADLIHHDFDEFERIVDFEPLTQCFSALTTVLQMDSRYPKFGALPEDIQPLLCATKEIGMQVVGVSFHVGSDCYDASAYADAIRIARDVYNTAESLGYKMTLLDVGGGYPGDSTRTLRLDDIAMEIKAALETYFPQELGVRFISEPGQLFVCAAGTLALTVISKRKNKPTDASSAPV